MSTTPQASFAIKELQTRFLYPFTLEITEQQETPDESESTLAQDAHDVLAAMSMKGRDGKPLPVWETEALPHPLYMEELLGHISKFLFDEAEQEQASYKYL